jgi:nitroreductase
MLEAARWAPTHKLTEPWHFVVLEGSSKEAFEVCSTVIICVCAHMARQLVLAGSQLQSAGHSMHVHVHNHFWHPM